ncbi:hypothetical protein D4764_11G0003710 [Takifugu flavidus]|uniref:Uncharacterized protein n=1 Tax=Takifugu flavidus TaxID=433684 RepID=A0A5C6PJ31_9TELE|nr:hypothetical protein D4764_11G0003710 [Takifugu flavidus]
MFWVWGGGPCDPVVPEWRGGSSARAHDGDSESAQNTRSEAGTTVEVEEPAELQGDHLDLQTESLTRELVKQTTTRMTETVLDMEDVGVEENSLNDHKGDEVCTGGGLLSRPPALSGVHGDFGQPSFTHQETYGLRKLMVKVRSRLESGD